MATRNAKAKEAAEIRSEEQATMLNVVMRDVIAQNAQSKLKDWKEALQKVQARMEKAVSSSSAPFPKPLEKREVERYFINNM